jgi:hypothetical protein
MLALPFPLFSLLYRVQMSVGKAEQGGICVCLGEGKTWEAKQDEEGIIWRKWSLRWIKTVFPHGRPPRMNRTRRDSPAKGTKAQDIRVQTERKGYLPGRVGYGG